MAKTLLIISGGMEAAGLAKRAKESGLYVIVSDGDPRAPGFEFSDSRLIADAYGSDETAAAAERFNRKIRKIDGALCVGADAPMTVAAVCTRLGIPGLSRETARVASDRMAMRGRFRAAGLRVPWCAAVDTPQELDRIAVEQGGELVVQPVDRRGARQIARANDLHAAFAAARSRSPTQRVMAEPFLAGPRTYAQSIVANGKCFTSALCDVAFEVDLVSQYPVENGGDLPSALTSELQAKIGHLVGKAAAALGIANSAVKSEIVVHEGEPHLVEMSTGLSGDLLCTRGIFLSSGVDFAGAAIDVALGECPPPDELDPHCVVPVICRYAFSRPGRVLAVGGAGEARALPGIAELVIAVKPGDIIPAGREKFSPAAMVLATGVTRSEALQRSNAALAQIRIETS
ncbi:MAG TPA: hypothetical protein VII49_13280 [Rhizomicrobium sp.]